MIRRLVIVLAVWCAATGAFAQPRDSRAVAPAGSASITGIVMSDGPEPRRLRRTRVTLSGGGLSSSRTVIANDNGTFAFDGLPAGRYTVSAAKDGYITLNFGAKRPNRPGTPIGVRSGEARRLTLRLPRGGVITGTISDQDGTPVAGVSVRAMAYRSPLPTGERRLAPVGISASGTDDRGVYRIYGLPAGEYFLTAQPPAPPGELRMLSASEVRQALADVKAAPRSQWSRLPGIPPAPAAQNTGPAPEPGPRGSYVPVFFPGTSDATRARPVIVESGQERASIDFQLEYVPAVMVQGTVAGAGTARFATVILAGRSSSSTGVDFLTRAAQPAPDGYFRFTGVTPGDYTLTSRVIPAADASSGRAASVPLYASTDIVVAGEDVNGITLSPQPGLTVSGKIVFEGTTPFPAAILATFAAGLGLPLGRAQPGGMFQPVMEVDPTGRFVISGIPPGPLSALGTRGIRTPFGPWWLRSIALDGRDALDTPLEVRQSTTEATITLSDRASDLTGSVADARGQPASGHYLVVFGTDGVSWFPSSRRIAAVRPGPDGRYTIRNLPAGEYFVVATDDIDDNQWFEVSTLRQLAARAAKISLADYERKTFNVVTGDR
jgi:Carboxypeptidase regulatory-like domain